MFINFTSVSLGLMGDYEEDEDFDDVGWDIDYPNVDPFWGRCVAESDLSLEGVEENDDF